MGEDALPAAGSTSRSMHLLDNSELSDAILQTFDIINRSSPQGPEITRAREHWWALLAERERRLSNTRNQGLAPQGETNA
jgi:hypothetical protein